MNVASLELCKALYEVSGWEAPLSWITDDVNEWVGDSDNNRLGHDIYRQSFAYDLGYLLRKLPDGCWLKKNHAAKSKGRTWHRYRAIDPFNTSATADTPEDAACRLAVELFKQGILKKDT